MRLRGILTKLKVQPESYYKRDEYDTGEIMGAGSYGVVRRATVKATGAGVAIKVVYKKRLRTDAQQNHVFKELDMLRQLSHPHIVSFVDWFESNSKYYIVTELCRGKELFDRISHGRHYTEEDAAHAVRQIAEATQYLHHRNIVHRDIKPENLLYLDDDQRSPLVLCDFGIASTMEDDEDELYSSIAGSLGYAAPEVVDDTGHGKPCDIWSLGVVTYSILSGHSPFRARTIGEFALEVGPGFTPRFPPRYFAGISDDAKDFVRRMISYEPDDRPTIDEVLAHPFLNAPPSASGVSPAPDLLPVIKEGLTARNRWRVAFEKTRLLKRLARLVADEDSDEEKQAVGSLVDTLSPAAEPLKEDAGLGVPGRRFQEVVVAAQRTSGLLGPSEA